MVTRWMKTLQNWTGHQMKKQRFVLEIFFNFVESSTKNQKKRFILTRAEYKTIPSLMAHSMVIFSKLSRKITKHSCLQVSLNSEKSTMKCWHNDLIIVDIVFYYHHQTSSPPLKLIIVLFMITLVPIWFKPINTNF